MLLGQARTPAGMRIYAIGDIHGRADLLTAALVDIEADLASAPPDDWRVIALGDYTDRGPQSREAVDLLVARATDPHFIFLRGNHDDRLVNFIDHPDLYIGDFLGWGGFATLASYGVDVTGASGVTDLELSRALRRRFPPAHRRFFAGLSEFRVEGDYFFVHAGVRPGTPLDRQDSNDLIWIRDEFLDHTGPYDKVIVHGHTISDRVDIRPNRINIDTGAFHSGVLTTLVLEGNDHRLMQADAGL